MAVSLGLALGPGPVKWGSREVLSSDGQVEGPPALKPMDIVAVGDIPESGRCVPTGAEISRAFFLGKRDSQVHLSSSIAFGERSQVVLGGFHRGPLRRLLFGSEVSLR